MPRSGADLNGYLAAADAEEEDERGSEASDDTASALAAVSMPAVRPILEFPTYIPLCVSRPTCLEQHNYTSSVTIVSLRVLSAGMDVIVAGQPAS